MKNVLRFMLLLPFIFQAQYVELAPWQNVNNNRLTIQELETNFEEFWLQKDKNVRASGYKPYKRYIEHWKQYTKEDGTIMPANEFWDQWRLKKTFIQSRSTFSNPISNWTALGPFSHINTGSWSSGQGRVNIVEVDPINPNTLYLGAPAGGIWKSTNGGNSWSPLTDELPQIGVSGIAIDPNNTNIIYIGTGDKDASDSYSVGVYKSLNGGSTWSATGLTFSSTTSKIGDVKIHPTNSQILWAATSAGIYKSTNAGESWSVVRTGNFSKGNIRLKPGNPDVVYAVSNNAFFKSTNGGTTFTQVTSNLPAASGRLVMDVTPANEDYLYILSANTSSGFQGLYKSTDSGTTFTAMNTTTNVFESTQAWYDLALCVSNTDPELVFTGCLNIWKSTNGGSTFTKFNSWSQPTSSRYTHADIHYLGYHGNRLICGSDGGIYISTNNGENFEDKTSDAQISQFYKIAVAKQTTTKIMGGLQDNGGYGLNNDIWQNFYGADGMDTAIHPTNNNIYYGFTQNGGTLNISNTSGSSLDTVVSDPTGETGNWVTPLKISNTGTLFSGFKKLYRLNGNSWVAQSTNTFTSNLSNIAMDNIVNSTIYVSMNAILYKSIDNGLNFTTLYTFPANITYVEINQSNSNKIYITTTGTTGKVYQSTDSGVSFTDITTGIPNIGKNVIKHQQNHPDDAIYVGTSLGVFYKDNTLSSFVPFDTNLPNVSVRDLDINIIDNKIVAATYGRGVWMSNLPQPLSVENIVTYNIGIYPNPNNGIFTVYSHFYTPETITILDVSGKKLQTFDSLNDKYNTIDISNYASGIYFVKININGNETTKKVVKN